MSARIKLLSNARKSIAFGAFGACLIAAASCSSLQVGAQTRASTAQTTVAAPTPIDQQCAAQAQLHIDKVEIVSATSIATGAVIPDARMFGFPGQPPGPEMTSQADFCRVIGRIKPEATSDIRFEVWLPRGGWNGRYFGVGNGGFAGSITYPDMNAAVVGGNAVASTDTGHQGDPFTASWARGRPDLVRDYGWRAVHLTALVAKQVVTSYYARSPDKSYFMSCSNGGREGLMEATRFPEDYDGIVVGAPNAVFTNVAMYMTWTGQAQQPEGAAIRANQMALLQQEVLAQCDALDGQHDGLIADPRRCAFDVRRVACGVSSSPQCFSPAQLAALRRIYQGPRDSHGRQLTPGFPATGAEAGGGNLLMGWAGWILRGEGGFGVQGAFAKGLLQDVTQTPFATPETFNFDTDPPHLRAALSADLDVQPDLHRFFDRGGKMILFHGWADPGLAPQGTIDFYEASMRRSGPNAASSMRLFMVPGLNHCEGGPGPADIGQHAPPQPGQMPDGNIGRALEAWVEQNRTPDTLIGRISSAPGATGDNQRLLCAYPKQAVLGVGPANSAASYQCRAPSRR